MDVMENHVQSNDSMKLNRFELKSYHETSSGKWNREEVVIANLRPDIVLWSQTKKTVVSIELTGTHEERVNEAYEPKRSK